MKYQIVYTQGYIKQFSKLDKQVQLNVNNWIKKHILSSEDPRNYGKPLECNFKDYWRYRIGDYRLLVKIVDDKAIIFAIKIGHRKEIYK